MKQHGYFTRWNIDFHYSNDFSNSLLRVHTQTDSQLNVSRGEAVAKCLCSGYRHKHCETSSSAQPLNATMVPPLHPPNLIHRTFLIKRHPNMPFKLKKRNKSEQTFSWQEQRPRTHRYQQLPSGCDANASTLTHDGGCSAAFTDAVVGIWWFLKWAFDELRKTRLFKEMQPLCCRVGGVDVTARGT